jgi:uncharacterized repeat protein (TIGR04076 family)
MIACSSNREQFETLKKGSLAQVRASSGRLLPNRRRDFDEPVGCGALSRLSASSGERGQVLTKALDAQGKAADAHGMAADAHRGPIDAPPDDSFALHDLRVEWVAGETCFCEAKPGDYFELHGEQLRFPPGQSWSIYALAALLPLLPAKQRMTHPNDWMSTDAQVACPDPNCRSKFLIRRVGLRTFRHSQVTAVPLPDAVACSVTTPSVTTGDDHG